MKKKIKTRKSKIKSKTKLKNKIKIRQKNLIILMGIVLLVVLVIVLFSFLSKPLLFSNSVIVRDVEDKNYLIGGDIVVNISVPVSGEILVLITEEIPEGVVVTDTGGGTLGDDGNLRWAIINEEGISQQEISYTLKINSLGNYNLGGEYSFGEDVGVTDLGVSSIFVCNQTEWVCGDYGECLEDSKIKECVNDCGETKIEVKGCFSCQDECSTGGKECVGLEQYKECGNYDEDSCLEWSDDFLSCDATDSCVNGNCIPLCTLSHYRKEYLNDCKSSGKRRVIYTKEGVCSGGVTLPTEEDCIYQAPVCESETYSSWSDCDSLGQQIRSKSSSPDGCAEQQSLPTIQSCLAPCIDSDWVSSDGDCSRSGKLTRTWTLVGNCNKTLGVVKSSEQINCDYQAPECESYNYTSWGDCLISGIKRRKVKTKIPKDCVGGENPFLTSECEYKECVEEQKKLCSNVDNGKIEGHKDICNESGFWSGENTCKINCNEGYSLIGRRCLESQLVSKRRNSLNESDLIKQILENKLVLKDDLEQRILLKFNKNFPDLKIKIKRSQVSEAKEFILIDAKNISNSTKTIYLDVKNSSSNGICFVDSEINLSSNLTDIFSGCVKMKCPSTKGNYGCKVNESVFEISGLKHSAVTEDYLYCGDGVCTEGEGCADCSSDCGACPIVQGGGSGGGGGGGGGGGSGRGTTTLTQILNNSGETDIDSSGEEDFSEEESGSTEIVDDSEENGFNIFWVFISVLVVLIFVIGIIIVVILKKKNSLEVEI
jgi:hypothetical protein